MVVSLVAVLAFGWVYGSMALAVNRADSSLAEVEVRIAALETERKQARGLDRIIEERGEDLNRIETFFVDRDHPLEFIERLESLAKTTGNLIALGVEGTPTASYLTFRITLDGLEANVTNYLKLFELLPYEMRVEEFSLQKISGSSLSVSGSTKSSDTRLTAVISVRTR